MSDSSGTIGPLLNKLVTARRIVLAGAALGLIYVGYKVHQKSQIQRDFEKTIDFVILDNQYKIQKDSLDKVHASQEKEYTHQNKILIDNYLTKKDSLLMVYINSLEK